MKTTQQHNDTGVLLFWITFVGFLVIENIVVEGSLSIANRWGHPSFGPYIAWVIFVVGGAVFARIELRSTSVGQKPPRFDILLRPACFMQLKLGYFGYFFNAAVLGPVATAFGLASAARPHRKALSVIGAVIFAFVWVTLLTTVWRQA